MRVHACVRVSGPSPAAALWQQRHSHAGVHLAPRTAALQYNGVRPVDKLRAACDVCVRAHLHACACCACESIKSLQL